MVLKRRCFSGAAISGESGAVGGRPEVKRAHSIEGRLSSRWTVT